MFEMGAVRSSLLSLGVVSSSLASVSEGSMRVREGSETVETAGFLTANKAKHGNRRAAVKWPEARIGNENILCTMGVWQGK